MSKFINPFSDYGFKLIFGSEVSKDLIISFLNGVLHDEVIINITFRNVEMLGMKQDQRRAVFDIFCENEGYFAKGFVLMHNLYTNKSSRMSAE
ncbi:PD-(D/E)XK nuclease family transposase, partial [Parabacteroides sp.]|uniref:PD-(D/E)XK nuclease family transposase n=1 Tax=Parabacteroides sp. TaxID=1869337 RepID=UPI00257DDD3C